VTWRPASRSGVAAVRPWGAAPLSGEWGHVVVAWVPAVEEHHLVAGEAVAA